MISNARSGPTSFIYCNGFDFEAVPIQVRFESAHFMKNVIIDPNPAQKKDQNLTTQKLLSSSL